MKKIFSGYYKPTQKEFNELWKNATFVLDANIILNIYRYPTVASNELLSVLEIVKDRLWIPYEVCLEYQRNRLIVIAEQKKRFWEVENILTKTKETLTTSLGQLQLKKRHSLIDPDEIINSVNKLIDKRIEKIKDLEGEHTSISDEDKIREKFTKIINGNIGKRIISQDELNKIYDEGKERFSVNIPPGYMDRTKEKNNESDTIYYDDLIYQRKFVDFVIWKQIITYAKKNKIKNLIFLTDDDKEDWWFYIKSQGNKKIGPRPELVQEIKTKAAVKNFYIYNSEQFLKYSKEYLKAKVSDSSIDHVRTLSQTDKKLSDYHAFRKMGMEAEQAVYNWLLTKYPMAVIERDFSSYPDFIVNDTDNQIKIGYEVKYIRNTRMIAMRLNEFIYRGFYETHNSEIDELHFIFVTDSSDSISEFSNRMNRRNSLPDNVLISIGIIVPSDNNREYIYKPIREFS